MNIIFGRKKKQEEPSPAPSPATKASSPVAARDRNTVNRGSSVNNITIPPRTNSTGASNPASAPGLTTQQQLQPGAQAQGQGQGQTQIPGRGPGPGVVNVANGSNAGISPRNNPELQQQQFYLSQQQQQQQQLQYQQQLGDNASPNSSMLLQQQQPMQPPGGPYNGDQSIVSQSIQYPAYNNEQQQQPQPLQMQGGGAGGMDPSSYDGGYAAGGAQEDQLQQIAGQQPQHSENSSPSNGHSDVYYGQTAGPGFENGSNGALTSGPLILPGDNNSNNNVNELGQHNGTILGANGAANGQDDTNSNNGGINSGELNHGSGEFVLSTDVRKLQEEVITWKKSQEATHARVGQLRQTLTQKSQENRDLHQSLTQVTQDRLMLQEMVHKREKEMDDLRSKYLNDVRQIRATDDDHSTIEQRIRMLQAAILQFTKSSAGDRAVNLNQDEVQHLVKKKYKFGNTQPYILNMFLEKFIMDSLLEEIFLGPFYVGFSLAEQYSEMYQWMVENNFSDQAVRFRQQVCFMSAKAPTAQAHAQEEAVRIAKKFEAKLEKLYNNWTGQQKILDLVTKAIELSLTMRSQNAEIQALVIPQDTEFDAERMVPAHKSKDGGKVKVCVMPCFLDTNGVVVGKAKVFCG